MTQPLTITLTVAAAHRLAQLAGTPGLLTSPVDLHAVGMVVEEHLLELPQPADRPADGAPAEVHRAWDRDQLALFRRELPPIELRQRRWDALRALVKAAAERGHLAGDLGSARLLREFRLAEDA